MSNKVDLSKFDNNWYSTGGSLLKRCLWYFCSNVFVNSYIFPFSSIKVWILKRFGANIGKSVVVKPGVNIKYPWNLTIGNNSWIGEGVWIDNLDKVVISNDVCISQGAYLLCGNHNYKSTAFDLVIAPIEIHSGAWVGAKSIVCPGVKVGTHAVLTLGSVAVNDLDPWCIYKGNPAEVSKQRILIN